MLLGEHRDTLKPRADRIVPNRWDIIFRAVFTDDVVLPDDVCNPQFRLDQYELHLAQFKWLGLSALKPSTVARLRRLPSFRERNHEPFPPAADIVADMDD